MQPGGKQRVSQASETSHSKGINTHAPHTQLLGVLLAGLYKPSACVNYCLSLFNMCAHRGEYLQSMAAMFESHLEKYDFMHFL